MRRETKDMTKFLKMTQTIEIGGLPFSVGPILPTNKGISGGKITGLGKKKSRIEWLIDCSRDCRTVPRSRVILLPPIVFNVILLADSTATRRTTVLIFSSCRLMAQERGIYVDVEVTLNL
jgi:hypothetical protein